MVKRKKRLEKQKKGLLKQMQKHQEKLKIEKGEKDTTFEYWKKEIKRFENQSKERENILKKLNKRKKK